MQYLRVPREEAVRSIPIGLILTFLTCGIYDLYWNAKEMKVFNGLLSHDEFSFWLCYGNRIKYRPHRAILHTALLSVIGYGIIRNLL